MMNMNKLNDDVTELIGRVIFYKDEQAKHTPPSEINTDGWIEKYQGRRGGTAMDYLKSVEYNAFRAEVARVTSSIMATIAKHQ